ncbi:unnamed protein product, partial [marine sediment metagenome]
AMLLGLKKKEISEVSFIFALTLSDFKFNYISIL